MTFKIAGIKIAGVVLAGGQSSRMGTDKKTLMYNEKTFLDIALDNLKKSGCNPVYISLANNFNNKNNVIEDKLKNIGALAGVSSTLNSLNENYIVFIPIDMPLLKPSIINSLIKQLDINIGIHYKEHIFPFIIKNSPHLINIINHQVGENKVSLKQFLKNINAKSITFNEDEKYLQNINYSEEFLRLKNAK